MAIFRPSFQPCETRPPRRVFASLSKGHDMADYFFPTVVWVVIAAARSDRHSGFVETVATLGGRRDHAERRQFLVAEHEYVIGRHGFVIDLERHSQLAA